MTCAIIMMSTLSTMFAWKRFWKKIVKLVALLEVFVPKKTFLKNVHIAREQVQQVIVKV